MEERERRKARRERTQVANSDAFKAIRDRNVLPCLCFVFNRKGCEIEAHAARKFAFLPRDDGDRARVVERAQPVVRPVLRVIVGLPRPR
jgi:superfamily II RNA helicase